MNRYGNLEDEATERNDFGDAAPRFGDAAAIDGGGEIFLTDLGGERKALILRADCGEAVRSYSSTRFARSSSEVIDTNASKSSVGS